MKIKIEDIIYGAFEIKEPVLITLINSKPLQRLKGIEQYGIPKELYSFPGFSRYDHSVGVMLLLRKLKANLEAQIAGLLHDVSHTAFSHIIDWVIGDQTKEDYQDKNHKNVVYNSEIPEILSSFGFDTAKVIDVEKYPLLEKEVPDLCVDRVDYALREFYYWANPKIVNFCIDNLMVFNEKIVFTSKEPAEVFGRNYLKCQTQHWGGVDAVFRYHLFSQVLKTAIDENIVLINDFYKDNDYIMEKLRASKNPQIRKLLKILSGKLDFEFTEHNPQLSLKKKFRYVDPEFLKNKILHRLSGIDSNYKTFLEEQRKINEKGINVNLLF